MIRKQLFKGAVSSTKTAVFTPANGVADIRSATVCNTTASTVNLSAWVGDNPIFINLPISANATQGLGFLIGHVIENGQDLELEASSGASLSALVCGVEG